MRLGPIKQIVIFGGGAALLQFAKWCVKQNLQINIFTSPRHLEEEINGDSFKKHLKSGELDYFECKELSAREITKIITNHDTSIGMSFGAAWIFNRKIYEDVFKTNY